MEIESQRENKPCKIQVGRYLYFKIFTGCWKLYSLQLLNLLIFFIYIKKDLKECRRGISFAKFFWDYTNGNSCYPQGLL